MPKGDTLEGRECVGLKAEECFTCGGKGHFQEAPICTGKKKNEKTGKVIKNRRVEEQETSEDSEAKSSSDSEELSRVVELVRAAGEKQTDDPELVVYLKSRSVVFCILVINNQ